MCSVDTQYVAVRTGHLMSQEACVAVSYRVIQHEPRAFCSVLGAATHELWDGEPVLMLSFLLYKVRIVKSSSIRLI